MKQVNIRQLGRLSAKALKAGPFEVVERNKPIGRFLPYGRLPKPLPKHDFTAEMTKAFGPLKQGKDFSFPELDELGTR